MLLSMLIAALGPAFAQDAAAQRTQVEDAPRAASAVAVSAGGTVPTVGVEATIHVTIAGPTVEAVELVDGAPLRLWIASSEAQTDAFRYDLRFTGLEPGRLDLAPFLRRADGSDDPIPAIPVDVAPLLGAGGLTSVEFEPEAISPLAAGHARERLLLAALLLFALPLAFLLVRRRARARTGANEAPAIDVSAELDRLTELAARERLTRDGFARLERLVVLEARAQELDRVERELLRAIRDQVHRPDETRRSELIELLRRRPRNASRSEEQ